MDSLPSGSEPCDGQRLSSLFRVMDNGFIEYERVGAVLSFPNATYCGMNTGQIILREELPAQCPS